MWESDGWRELGVAVVTYVWRAGADYNAKLM